MFAVQNGGWCASSPIAETTYNKYGASQACQTDGEGGGWANQVYKINTEPGKTPLLNHSLKARRNYPCSAG